MYDICCVGHITSDKVVNASGEFYMPGGTAWYFSYALNHLPVNYLLATALAPAEMRYVETLQSAGIEVTVQPSQHTVFFENIYGPTPDERTQRVLEKADPFRISGFDDIAAQIFHLGPLLADDIAVGLIKALAAKSRVSLDIQGYLRRVENQQVHACSWSESAEALPYIDILKADVAELQALSGYADTRDGAKAITALGVKELVITNGSQGSAIYSDGVFYNIPAYKPAVVADATGCGDTYMAGYLYQRAKGAGIEQAGHFAAAMAGLKTAVAGPFKGTADDIAAFMQSVVTA